MFNNYLFMFLLMLLLIACSYVYFMIKFKYWKKRGVVYIKPIFFFGNLKDRVLKRKSFHEFTQEIYLKLINYKYGGIFEGLRPCLVILDPELIKDIYIKDFDHFTDRPMFFQRDKYIQKSLLIVQGAHWKKIRALATPVFTSGKLKAMEILIIQCAENMVKNLMDQKDTTNAINMKKFYGCFTLDVIASCAFGIECNSIKDSDTEFVKIIRRFSDISTMARLAIFCCLMFIPVSFQKYFTIQTTNRQTISFLAEIIKKTIVHRQEHNERRNDFLQLMIDASVRETKDSNIQRSEIPVIDEYTIIAQSILFMLAGFETSSTLLTFASYELALNPDIQDKLRHHVNTILNKYEGYCTHEALNEMDYLEMVFYETLRKHPPVPRIDRVCTKDYKIHNSELVIEKGTKIYLPVIGIHYDEKYYPDPNKFDPNRFDQQSARNSSIFLPFGIGPRNCIGLRFAMMSVKIGMVYLIRNFEFVKTAKTKVPYQTNKSSFFLDAEGGIWLEIKPIKKYN